MIVDESVKQHQAQANLIESLKQDLDKVLAEHQKLVTEFHNFRQCSSLPASSEHPTVATGLSLHPPDNEGSIETNKIVFQSTAIDHQRQDIFYPHKRDSLILAAHEPAYGRPFDVEGIEQQVPLFQGQSIHDSNEIANFSNTFEVSSTFSAPPALNASIIQSSDLNPGLQVANTPMGFSDPPTLQMYGNNHHWNQDQHLNGCEMFNISYSGAPHSSLISNG